MNITTLRTIPAMAVMGAISATALQAGDVYDTVESGKSPIEKAPVVEAEGINLPDENLWLYTKGTNTRSRNSWELKVQDIAALDKDSGNYEFHDMRVELEYGITDRLTLGVEGIFFHHDYNNVEWAPMVDTQGGPGGSFEKTQVGGFEVSTKYNLLDPFEDFIGASIGLGFEHRQAYQLDGARIDQDAVVPQLFLQKSMLDDHLQWAFLGKMEFEQRKSPGVLEEEIALDLATGLSYRVADRLWVGIESRFQTDFLSPQEDGVIEGNKSDWDWGQFALGDQFQWGLYVGPTVHYESLQEEGEFGKWWVTAGALAQVAGYSMDGAAASSNGKNWDEHEKWHVGIIVGYEWGEGYESD